MPSRLKNPILRQAEDAIEKNLTPSNRANYLKVVVSGLRLGMDGGKDSMIAQLANMDNPVDAAAVGAVNVTLLMKRAARGKMPEVAIVPAASCLMLHALDMLELMGKLKVTNEILGKATKKLTDALFQGFKITQATLDLAANKARETGSNPQALNQIQQFTSKGQAQKPPLQQ